jgi:hypothetical protein
VEVGPLTLSPLPEGEGKKARIFIIGRNEGEGAGRGEK